MNFGYIELALFLHYSIPPVLLSYVWHAADRVRLQLLHCHISKNTFSSLVGGSIAPNASFTAPIY